jgi:transposase
MLPTLAKGSDRMPGTRRADQPHVQLFVAGAAGTSRSPIAPDPADDGRGPRVALGPVHKDVLGHGPALDPPEQLSRALLLQSLYTIRSERLLMEEIDYSVLFRWFVGLGMDEPIWSPTTFSKNRDRLVDSDIAAAFLDAVIAQARTAGLLSDEHFTVDGTLLEAGASLKSFRRKDEGPTPPPDDPGNPTVNFHGEVRRNDTHQSTTDPDAMLARKGPVARRSCPTRGMCCSTIGTA